MGCGCGGGRTSVVKYEVWRDGKLVGERVLKSEAEQLRASAGDGATIKPITTR